MSTLGEEESLGLVSYGVSQRCDTKFLGFEDLGLELTTFIWERTQRSELN